MSWFFLAFGTACCEATKDLLSKKTLATKPAVVVTFWLCTLTSLAMLPLLIWQGLPPLTSTYWLALGSSTCLNTTAFLLYNRALKVTDLSLVVPMVTLSPLFMFVTSPLIVGEFGQWSDFGGSLLLVFGSYILNWEKRSTGYLAPLRSLWKNPGSRQMLIVAFIWSFTANIDKVGIQNSSIFCWILSLYATIALSLLGLIWRQGRTAEIKPQRSLLYLIGFMGAFHALGIVLQMQALKLTLVVRVISVKRLSALIGVLFGALFLKEIGLRHRLLGAGLMVAGVALLL
ncbi:MAG: EamA family transporter [Prochlorotrichaceae cyanobacterium]|jgi:drug/metabolite transporter (DMT)-like permease